MPAGSNSCKRFSAPPVSSMVGLPKGRFTTEYATAKPGAERLGAGLLGGESLGIGSGPIGAAVGFALFDRSEATGDEAVAETLERFLDPPNIDQVAAKADDHAEHRPIRRCARRWFRRAPGPSGRASV
jgi:hypothetical protein